jgi:uncharacterized protein YprB with RNaseH-like and TPR domain
MWFNSNLYITLTFDCFSQLFSAPSGVPPFDVYITQFTKLKLETALTRNIHNRKPMTCESYVRWRVIQREVGYYDSKIIGMNKLEKTAIVTYINSYPVSEDSLRFIQIQLLISVSAVTLLLNHSSQSSCTAICTWNGWQF